MAVFVSYAVIFRKKAAYVAGWMLLHQLGDDRIVDITAVTFCICITGGGFGGDAAMVLRSLR